MIKLYLLNELTKFSPGGLIVVKFIQGISYLRITCLFSSFKNVLYGYPDLLSGCALDDESEYVWWNATRDVMKSNLIVFHFTKSAAIGPAVRSVLPKALVSLLGLGERINTCSPSSIDLQTYIYLYTNDAITLQ